MRLVIFGAQIFSTSGDPIASFDAGNIAPFRALFVQDVLVWYYHGLHLVIVCASGGSSGNGGALPHGG